MTRFGGSRARVNMLGCLFGTLRCFSPELSGPLQKPQKSESSPRSSRRVQCYFSEKMLPDAPKQSSDSTME